MNKHTVMEIQLSVYRDLTPAARHEVDQHVAACTACRAKLARYTEQAQLITGFVEQRQQALWRAHPRQVGSQLPAFQPLRAQTWLATWRFVLWPALHRQQPRVAMSLAFVLLLVFVVAATLDRMVAFPVVAQPTPVPTHSVATPEPAAMAAARQGIEEALAREEAARNGNDRAHMAEYFDPDADAVWKRAYQSRHFSAYNASDNLTPVRLSVADMIVMGDFAQVRVHTKWEGDVAWGTQEEGRFYRRVDGQWYLTAPDTDAWGETRVITTASFRIEYGAVDEAVVEATAPKLETAYQKLIQILDLPQGHPTSEYPYTPTDLPYFHEGKINVAFVPQFIDSWPRTDTTLRLTSPFLRTLLQGISPADELTYSVMVHVGSSLVREAKGDSYWHILSIEQWLIEDSLEQPPWRGSTYMVERTQEFLSLHTVLQFDDFPTYNDGGWPIVVGNLLMDYIVDTYGRAMIPEFVRGLGTYVTWEELIPAVFDVSAGDFEITWNTWLSEHYGQGIDLVNNGNFVQPLGDTWDVYAVARQKMPRDAHVIEEGTRSVLQLTSYDHEGYPNEIRLTQSTSRSVTAYNSLILALDLQIFEQTLPGAGYLGREYPLAVEVTYRNARGHQHVWTHGFYAVAPEDEAWALPNGEQVQQHQWYQYQSPNLMEVMADGPPTIIESIRIKASGWNYGVKVADVHLWGD